MSPATPVSRVVLPVALLVLLSSCGEAQGPESTIPEAPAGRVACPADARASASVQVDPQGGRLALPNGHSISFPRGSVPSRTTFELVEPRADYVVVELLGPSRTFPEGARPTLEISTARCGAAVVAEGLRILRWSGSRWDPVPAPTAVRTEGNVSYLSVVLDHFSIYTLGTI